MYVNPGIHLTPSLADMGQFFSPKADSGNTRELSNGRKEKSNSRRATPLKDKKLKELIIKQRNLTLSQQNELSAHFRNKEELSDRLDTLVPVATPFTEHQQPGTTSFTPIYSDTKSPKLQAPTPVIKKTTIQPKEKSARLNLDEHQLFTPAQYPTKQTLTPLNVAITDDDLKPIKR